MSAPQLTFKTFDARAYRTWLFILGALTGGAVAWFWSQGINPNTEFSAAILVIAYSPSLAAIITALMYGGKAGLQRLLAPILIWRVSLGWYALALLGPFILIGLANLLSGPAAAPTSGYFELAALAAGFGPILAGSLGEEIGWRGLAQRLLQHRYSALIAAIIVGAIWATWHLWPMLSPRAPIEAADILQTYVRLIATAIIYAWIFNNTRGSLLLVMLAHAGHNLAITLMPPATTGLALTIAALYAVAAGAVVVLSGAKTLTSSGPAKV